MDVLVSMLLGWLVASLVAVTIFEVADWRHRREVRRRFDAFVESQNRHFESRMRELGVDDPLGRREV